jgi:hypothetical protein
MFTEIRKPPPHDPLAKPDRRGDLAALSQSPDGAGVDAQQFCHLADVDHRDVRLSNLKFIHECTPIATAAQDNESRDAPCVGAGWFGSLQVGSLGLVRLRA